MDVGGAGYIYTRRHRAAISRELAEDFRYICTQEAEEEEGVGGEARLTASHISSWGNATKENVVSVTK